MASVASWADDYRAAHPDTAGWHFVNIPLDKTAYDPDRDCAKGDCIIQAIERLRATVGDCSRTAGERSEALKFLIHFVGDIHQPLHDETRFAADGKDDHGGNSLAVTFFGQPTNLHAVWDTGLIMHTVYDWGAYVTRLQAGWLGGWPDGEDSRIAMIRATAISTPVGDLHPELLSAGHAIIHDKIIVIDPLDKDACAVITGSHNLGYKASYDNDENLLIIRGNQGLALCYAVHIIDVYQHYLMRAKQEDQERQQLLAGKTAKPPSTNHGFLKTTDVWQGRFFQPQPPTIMQYFLPGGPQAATHAKAADARRKHK